MFILPDNYYDLDAALRHSIREWVAFGGHLFFVADGDSKETAQLFGFQTLNRHQYGFGTVQRISTEQLTETPHLVDQILDNGKTLLLESLVSTNSNSTSHLSSHQIMQHKRNSPFFKTSNYSCGLYNLLSPIKTPYLYLLSVLLLFVLPVGPVNFFVFCKRHRTRLLWTIPLISFSSTLMILLFAMLHDGFGGEGYRASLNFLDTKNGQLFRIQEQYSKTGILFSPELHPPEGSYLQSLILQDGSSMGNFNDLQVSGNRLTGGWIKSRSMHGHRVFKAEASRSKIRIQREDNGNYLANSSMPVMMERFYWMDGEENAYACKKLVQGVRVQLEPISKSEFKQDYEAALSLFSGPAIAEMPKPRKHLFFALSSLPSCFQTDEVINWKEETSVWFGKTVENER